MPATATVSAWRNRAVNRAVPVAGMARSYRGLRCIAAGWSARLWGPGIGNPGVCRWRCALRPRARRTDNFCHILTNAAPATPPQPTT